MKPPRISPLKKKIPLTAYKVISSPPAQCWQPNFFFPTRSIFSFVLSLSLLPGLVPFLPSLSTLLSHSWGIKSQPLPSLPPPPHPWIAMATRGEWEREATVRYNVQFLPLWICPLMPADFSGRYSCTPLFVSRLSQAPYTPHPFVWRVFLSFGKKDWKVRQFVNIPRPQVERWLID